MNTSLRMLRSLALSAFVAPSLVGAAEPAHTKTRFALPPAVNSLVGRLSNEEVNQPSEPMAYPAHPIHVRISREFLEQQLDRSLVRERKVDDEILGTKITGTAHLDARLTVKLLPVENGASGEVTLSGDIFCRTVGVNGPVTLHNEAKTTIEIRKQIVFEDGQLRLTPLAAKAETHSTTQRIDSKLPGMRGEIAKSVAQARATELRGEADRIASEHTLAKIDREFETRIQQAFSPAGESSLYTMLHAAFAKMELPLDVRLRSTADYLELAICHVNADAHHASSPTSFANHPHVGVRVHRQTLVWALGEPSIRGLFAPLVTAPLNDGPLDASTTKAAGWQECQLNWSEDGQWLSIEYGRHSLPLSSLP